MIKQEPVTIRIVVVSFNFWENIANKLEYRAIKDMHKIALLFKSLLMTSSIHGVIK